MSVVLGFITLLAALLAVAVSATALQLRASDPAGNGLAQAFLAFGVIALWAVLIVALVVTAMRQQRYPLAWSSINGYALAVLVLAVAGQAACLIQLAGRNVDGWFRIVLQLGVIIPPVAALAHIAWRAYGVPIPMRVATTGVALVIGVLSVAALLGLMRGQRTTTDFTAKSIFYPALLVRDDVKIEVIENADGLTSMNSNYVVNRTGDPLVIDSHFAIFELRDLQLAKSALGLLVRGQGVERVTFRVIPYEPSGTPESVRAVVLRVKYLSADPDKDAAMRRDLASVQTLDEILAILNRP